MSFDPEPYIRFHLSENAKETRAIAERVERARGDPTHVDFDIDLALDGGDDYLALDLLVLKNLPVHFREQLQTTGIVFTAPSTPQG